MVSTKTNLINAHELRQRLGGISENTLDRWLANPSIGLPVPIRIGRRRIWEESDIEAFVRSHKESDGTHGANS